MKRYLVITFAAIALPIGGAFSLLWLFNLSSVRNTAYSERYSWVSFAGVNYGLPRAKVIEALGAPLSTTTYSSYPVWALRSEDARNRYGRDNSIPVESAMFSMPRDSKQDFHWVEVSFGPEGTVLDTFNYITD